MARAFIIVLDGVGAGEMPDASEYGDQGSNTLGNLARAEGGLDLPFLGRMGMGNILDLEGVPREPSAIASWGLMRELSKGKDTITGHWEMTGVLTPRPFPTYPEGFPPEIIEEFQRRIGREVLCNRPASGTEIIKQLGDEHMRTGKPIVYTSADSVFQIAAHEDVISPDELYRMCRTARDILKPPHNVCRVIARPFVGPPYKRTYRRKDFALEPPERTVLDMLQGKGLEVVSIGKVADMFSGRGFSRTIKTEGNSDGMAKLKGLLGSFDEGLVFCNLVDFDTLYGHRNDTSGFHSALKDFDTWMSGFLPALGEGDYLFITADHGLDPTTPSTDHSREHVPILFYEKNLVPRDLGMREGFWDIGATVAGIFSLKGYGKGRSFIQQ